jgi:hypothetical protein
MLVKIGPYVNYIGPYQIAEKLLFWIPKYDGDNRLEYSEGYNKYVYPLGEFLAGTEKETLLSKLCSWIHSKQKRKVKVRIDPHDTWSMDHTLAMVVLPMLKQLRDTAHGSPMVDLEDVPENLRAYTHQQYDCQKSFDWYHEDTVEELTHTRWAWIMNEMIWAFEQVVDDDSQFDMQKFDITAYNKHHDRVNNGLRLFGKYYRGLWD